MKTEKSLKSLVNATKTISMAVLTSFIMSSVVQPVTAAISAPALEMKNFSINNFEIAPSIGRISEEKNYGSKQLVINIQDLHCHAQVQKNISEIIETLDKKYKVKNIYLEGVAGQIDTSWIKGIKDEKERNEIVEKLLEKGKLTGAEYYAIKSDRPEVIKGIETESLYKENFTRLNKIIENKNETAEIVKEIKEKVKPVREAYYNDRQQKVIKINEQFKNGKLSPAKYYTMLQKYAESTEIDLTDYKNIRGFINLIKEEGKLNYRSAAVELKKYTEELKERLPYKTYKMLMEETRNFSQLDKLYMLLVKNSAAIPAVIPEVRNPESRGVGGVKGINKNDEMDSGFHRNDDAALSSAVRIQNAMILPRPGGALAKFFRYVELSQKINAVELVKEEKNLIKEITVRLAGDESAREAVFTVDFVNYLEEYLSNKISADNYEYFVRNLPKFKLLMEKFSGKGRLEKAEKYFDLMDKYYQANIKRNNCFLNNIGCSRNNSVVAAASAVIPAKAGIQGVAVDSKQNDVIILITGGFHTEGLTDLLRERKISYQVITPNVTEESKKAELVYAQLAREQSKILENAFALMALSGQPQAAKAAALTQIEIEKYISIQNSAVIQEKINQKLKDWNINGVEVKIKSIDKENSQYEFSVGNYTVKGGKIFEIEDSEKDSDFNAKFNEVKNQILKTWKELDSEKLVNSCWVTALSKIKDVIDPNEKAILALITAGAEIAANGQIGIEHLTAEMSMVSMLAMQTALNLYSAVVSQFVTLFPPHLRGRIKVRGDVDLDSFVSVKLNEGVILSEINIPQGQKIIAHTTQNGGHFETIKNTKKTPDNFSRQLLVPVKVYEANHDKLTSLSDKKSKIIFGGVNYTDERIQSVLISLENDKEKSNLHRYEFDLGSILKPIFPILLEEDRKWLDNIRYENLPEYLEEVDKEIMEKVFTKDRMSDYNFLNLINTRIINIQHNIIYKVLFDSNITVISKVITDIKNNPEKYQEISYILDCLVAISFLDSYEHIRIAAIEVLGAIGEDNYIRFLSIHLKTSSIITIKKIVFKVLGNFDYTNKIGLKTEILNCIKPFVKDDNYSSPLIQSAAMISYAILNGPDASEIINDNTHYDWYWGDYDAYSYEIHAPEIVKTAVTVSRFILGDEDWANRPNETVEIERTYFRLPKMKKIEIAYKLLEMLKRENKDVLENVTSVFIAIYKYIPEKKDDIAEKIAEILKNENKDVRVAAVTVLGEIYTYLSEEKKADILEKVAEMIEDNDYNVRKAAVYALYNMYIDIPKIKKADIAKKVAERLEDRNEVVRKEAIILFQSMYAQITDELKKVEIAYMLLEMFKNEDVRADVISVFIEIFKYVPEREKTNIACKAVEMLENENKDIRANEIFVFEYIHEYIPEQKQAEIIYKVIKMFENEDEEVHSVAIKVFKKMYAHITDELNKVEIAFQIALIFKTESVNSSTRADVVTLFRKIIKYLSEKEKTEIADKIIKLFKNKFRATIIFVFLEIFKSIPEKEKARIACKAVEMLENEDIDIRENDVRLYEEIYNYIPEQKQAEIIYKVVKMFENEDEEVRKVAIKVFKKMYAHITDELNKIEIAYQVALILKNESIYVRADVISVFIEIFKYVPEREKTNIACKAVEMLENENKDIRANEIFVFEYIQEYIPEQKQVEIISKVIRMFANEDEEVRKVAVKIIAKRYMQITDELKKAEMVYQLAEKIEEKNRNVRNSALQTLTEIYPYIPSNIKIKLEINKKIYEFNQADKKDRKEMLKGVGIKKWFMSSRSIQGRIEKLNLSEIRLINNCAVEALVNVLGLSETEKIAIAANGYFVDIFTDNRGLIEKEVPEMSLYAMLKVLNTKGEYKAVKVENIDDLLNFNLASNQKMIVHYEEENEDGTGHYMTIVGINREGRRLVKENGEEIEIDSLRGKRSVNLIMSKPGYDSNKRLGIRKLGKKETKLLGGAAATQLIGYVNPVNPVNIAEVSTIQENTKERVVDVSEITAENAESIMAEYGIEIGRKGITEEGKMEGVINGIIAKIEVEEKAFDLRVKGNKLELSTNDNSIDIKDKKIKAAIVRAVLIEIGRNKVLRNKLKEYPQISERFEGVEFEGVTVKKEQQKHQYSDIYVRIDKEQTETEESGPTIESFAQTAKKLIRTLEENVTINASGLVEVTKVSMMSEEKINEIVDTLKGIPIVYDVPVSAVIPEVRNPESRGVKGINKYNEMDSGFHRNDDRGEDIKNIKVMIEKLKFAGVKLDFSKIKIGDKEKEFIEELIEKVSFAKIAIVPPKNAESIEYVKELSREHSNVRYVNRIELGSEEMQGVDNPGENEIVELSISESFTGSIEKCTEIANEIKKIASKCGVVLPFDFIKGIKAMAKKSSPTSAGNCFGIEWEMIIKEMLTQISQSYETPRKAYARGYNSEIKMSKEDWQNLYRQITVEGKTAEEIELPKRIELPKELKEDKSAQRAEKINSYLAGILDADNDSIIKQLEMPGDETAGIKVKRIVSAARYALESTKEMKGITLEGLVNGTVDIKKLTEGLNQESAGVKKLKEIMEIMETTQSAPQLKAEILNKINVEDLKQYQKDADSRKAIIAIGQIMLGLFKDDISNLKKINKNCTDVMNMMSQMAMRSAA